MAETTSQPTGTHDKPKCKPLPAAPEVPTIPEPGPCPTECTCPTPPGGPPSNCLDQLIRDQNIIVKKADRAKAFVDELTQIQSKVTSALADYTQKRFTDLRKLWEDQDKRIPGLIHSLVCAVPCWKCLLQCRLCKLLVEIRTLEDRLNGTGELTKKVYSLFDLQAWHQRNVANMEARVTRIKDVLEAWEKPSDTLGDVLDKNDKLIKATEQNIGTDAAKAVYDIFMTLLPRHWAIRPRDATSAIDLRYIHICECPKAEPKGEEKQNQQPEKKSEKCDCATPKPPECQCDDGTPDDCCGPDVGILTLRERLIGRLPYIVDPTNLATIICCLTSERLSSASDQLATAQANLDATTAEIELVKKRIDEKKSGIEAAFTADLTNPIDCEPYNNGKPKPDPQKPKDPGCGYAEPEPANQATAP